MDKMGTGPNDRNVCGGLMPAEARLRKLRPGNTESNSGQAPGASVPALRQRSKTVLLPAAPFDQLPVEVQGLVLHKLDVPHLLSLQSVSFDSNVCIHDYAVHDISPAQARQWRDQRQSSHARQLAYSCHLFGATWSNSRFKPCEERKAAALKMALAQGSLRLPLTVQNRKHWPEMVQIASYGNWQHLELDFHLDETDTHFMHARALMSFIAGLGDGSRRLHLYFQLFNFNVAGATALSRLLRATPQVNALFLNVYTNSAESLSTLASGIGESALEHFSYRCYFDAHSGSNPVYRALAGAHLKSFCLTDIALYDEQSEELVQALESCLGLTEFTVNPKGFRRYGAQAFSRLTEGLAKLENLRKLDLTSLCPDCNLAGMLAPLVAQTSTLEILYVSQHGFGNGGLIALAQALEQNDCLQWLSLTDNTDPDVVRTTGSEGSKALFQSLLVNDCLRRLCLQGVQQTLESGLALADMLRGKAGLEELELIQMHWPDHDTAVAFFELIMDGLSSNTSLTRFALKTGEHFSDATLCAMLRKNRTLQQLELQDAIDNAQATLRLAAALEGNFCLTELALPYCSSIDVESEDQLAIAVMEEHGRSEEDGRSQDGLCALITGNNGLRRLRLRDCFIRIEAQLVAALSANTRLSMLDLSANLLDDENAIALLQAVARHPSLSVFLLKDVALSYASLEAFAVALGQRTLPLYIEMDEKLFSLTKIVEEEDVMLSRQQRMSIRHALLAAQTTNPSLVIRGLGQAMATEPEWNWRDFVRE